jgi:hypothetical protein
MHNHCRAIEYKSARLTASPRTLPTGQNPDGKPSKFLDLLVGGGADDVLSPLVDRKHTMDDYRNKL